MCTVPQHFIKEQLERIDYNMRSALSKDGHSTISDLTWHQASLPFRPGCLGLRQAQPNVHVAFLASSYTSQDLVARLLSSTVLNLESSPIPGKTAGFNAWKDVLGLPWSNQNMAQTSFQALLDEAFLTTWFLGLMPEMEQCYWHSQSHGRLVDG